MKLLFPENESERRNFYRWQKQGILKPVNITEKSISGRPKNYYTLNTEYFKNKTPTDLNSFLETVYKIKKYINFAIGLPFSLMKYKYLQISSIYLYTNYENLQTINEIFPDYKFLNIFEVPDSILERKVEYKRLPLISLEDTILFAIKHANNVMCAYTLLKTQINEINFPLLFSESKNRKIDLSIFTPFFTQNNLTLYKQFNLNTTAIIFDLDNLENAAQSLLKRKYDWKTAMLMLKNQYKSIDEIKQVKSH